MNITEKLISLHESSNTMDKLFRKPTIKKYGLKQYGLSSLIYVTEFGEMKIDINYDDDYDLTKFYLIDGDDDRSVGAYSSDVASFKIGEKPRIDKNTMKDLKSNLPSSDIKFLMKMIKDFDEDLQSKLELDCDKSDTSFKWYSNDSSSKKAFSPMSLTTKEYYSTIEQAKERIGSGEFYAIKIEGSK